MEVFLPGTLTELWKIFAAYPEGAIMAGGTDLLVRLRTGGLKPSALICLEKIAELQKIEDNGQEIFIGAGVTHQRLLDAGPVMRRLPVLQAALSQLGSPPIRHSGTIGGNLCSASPAGDLLPPLYVLDGIVEIRSENNIRRLPVGEFVTGPGTTALRQGEIVTGIRVSPPPAEAFSAYYKVGKRKALAISIVSLASVLTATPAGIIGSISLAWGSAGPTVVRLPEVEAFLTGKVLSGQVLRQAAAMVAARLSPIDDLRASAGYRRKIAGNLLQRLALWEPAD